MTARGVAVMVAYYAPPAVGVAANRLAAMLRHLPDLGWDPVVVAPESPHHHRSAASEAALAGVRVVRTRNPEPSRWFRRMAGAGAEDTSQDDAFHELLPLAAGPVASRVRRLVREWLYVPDAQLLWIPAAARAAEACARGARGRPTVLFSTSVPYSCHFAARAAAAATGVPWVAEYRDPWSVAPPRSGARSALRRLVDRRLDHGVATRADRLVVTSDETRRLFLRGFPEIAAVRTAVVRNGFEDEGLSSATDAAPPDGPLRLAYAGSLLEARWAHVLLAALDLVERMQPGAVVLDVHGPKDPWTALTGAGRGERGFLRVHGMAPVAEVAGKLRSSSALVLLQPDALSYVPGKTYDYLGARRPVVAAVPRTSETAALLARFGELHLVGGLDATGVAGVLRALLERHRRGALAEPSVPAHVVTPLCRRSQVAVLAGVFDEVARR
ncbi:MAG: glycosyltransferase family 4 protein [Gemmatimonadetes bacterium]|nr:glycosyltransferase family 4 protein [Gemmatimonadota bacterium]